MERNGTGYVVLRKIGTEVVWEPEGTDKLEKSKRPRFHLRVPPLGIWREYLRRRAEPEMNALTVAIWLISKQLDFFENVMIENEAGEIVPLEETRKDNGLLTDECAGHFPHWIPSIESFLNACQEVEPVDEKNSSSPSEERSVNGKSRAEGARGELSDALDAEEPAVTSAVTATERG